jgi:hypothetical protein
MFFIWSAGTRAVSPAAAPAVEEDIGRISICGHNATERGGIDHNIAVVILADDRVWLRKCGLQSGV